MQFSDSIVEQLAVYTGEIISWNKKMSLISNKDESRIVDRHIIEAVITANILNNELNGKSSTVMDMGAGSGLPGIPLSICYPHVNVVLVEAQHKKCVFMQHTKNKLKLKNVEVVNDRIENLHSVDEYINKFDLVTARALASMDKLLDWAEPFLKTDNNETDAGICIFPKGSRLDEELKNETKDKWEIKSNKDNALSKFSNGDLYIVSCSLSKTNGNN